MSALDKVSKYEVLEKIAESSFAIVYKGRDPFTRRLVAIKIAVAQDETLRDRFLAAAEKAASLQHPSIVRIYEFGSGDGKPYLVEEFLSGSDFRSLIPSGPREPQRKLNMLLQVATALAFAHRRGVLHRDLKPATVHVEPNDRIKVVDFGLSRLGSANAWLAGEDRMAGGQGYLPPELALGLEADARTDVYCFGALTYELLSARKPFAAQSYPELVRQTLEGKPVPLVARWRDCPPALSDLADRCLERDPGARPSSFADLIEELVPIVEKLTGEDTRGAKVLPMSGRASPRAEEEALDDTQEIPPLEIDPEETEDYLATAFVEHEPTPAPPKSVVPDTQFVPELAARDALATTTRSLALAALPAPDDDGDATHPDLEIDPDAALRESPTRPGIGATVDLDAAATVVELATLPGVDTSRLVTAPPIAAGTLPAMEPVTRTLLELERRAEAGKAEKADEGVLDTTLRLPPAALPDAVAPPPPRATTAESAAKPSSQPALPQARRPAGKRRWGLILAVGLVLLALAAAGLVGLVWYMRNQPSPVASPTTPARPAPAPAPSVATGRIVIIAAPWAEVRTLTDDRGSRILLPPGSTTPASLAVPPGRYTATLGRPGDTATATCQTVVASGQAALCRAELAKPKALDYFKEAGWWR